MIVLKGVGASDGIAIAHLNIESNNIQACEKRLIKDVELELKRYETAREQAICHTKSLYEKALADWGEKEAEIFKSHEMMLKDKDYRSSIEQIITQENSNAEYAIQETSKQFSKIFSDMSDPYMKSRAIDVTDISTCILNSLFCQSDSKVPRQFSNSTLLFKNDFAPSEISSFDKKTVKGILCSEGSLYSHTSILLRVMKIPSVVGIKDKLDDFLNGKLTIIDGSTGEVFIDPDEVTLKFFKNKKQEYTNSYFDLKSVRGKPSITTDGQIIKLYANMNNPEEIEEIIKNDSEGIGLVRSEFIYLGRKSFPTEEEQFKIYKEIIEKMNGKEVIIRTLDIGSDKRADYFELPKECNPALGYRGIRVCLEKSEVFLTQLKAIYRASNYGKVSIMFPMITSIEEVNEIKNHLKTVKEDLKVKNVPFSNDVKIGVMIETPAAVMISDELAKEVDFFSVGTNDLTQYTLAVDRQNSKVNSLFNAHHKSILRMIKMIVKNAHSAGIEVGICGESASDESLLETFLALGVDKLSMTSHSILKMRKLVLTSNVSKMKKNVLSNL